MKGTHLPRLTCVGADVYAEPLRTSFEIQKYIRHQSMVGALSDWKMDEINDTIYNILPKTNFTSHIKDFEPERYVRLLFLFFKLASPQARQ